MPKRNPSEFTKWLKSKGLNLRVLSERTGINYGHLSLVACGYRAMSDEKWALVARAVKVPEARIPKPEPFWVNRTAAGR